MSEQETSTSLKAEHGCCCGMTKEATPHAATGADRRSSTTDGPNQLSGWAYWRKVLLRIWEGARAPAPRRSA
jgi:hypothetical protein